ncbi:hypothetical protein GGF31_002723 [Allomyces arbusculus]|nr:hypothetical protein GGF31_002723 [Allomyces arbusculus]
MPAPNHLDRAAVPANDKNGLASKSGPRYRPPRLAWSRTNVLVCATTNNPRQPAFLVLPSFSPPLQHRLFATPGRAFDLKGCAHALPWPDAASKDDAPPPAPVVGVTVEPILARFIAVHDAANRVLIWRNQGILNEWNNPDVFSLLDRPVCLSWVSRSTTIDDAHSPPRPDCFPAHVFSPHLLVAVLASGHVHVWLPTISSYIHWSVALPDAATPFAFAAVSPTPDGTLSVVASTAAGALTIWDVRFTTDALAAGSATATTALHVSAPHELPGGLRGASPWIAMHAFGLTSTSATAPAATVVVAASTETVVIWHRRENLPWILFDVVPLPAGTGSRVIVRAAHVRDAVVIATAAEITVATGFAAANFAKDLRRVVMQVADADDIAVSPNGMYVAVARGGKLEIVPVPQTQPQGTTPLADVLAVALRSRADTADIFASLASTAQGTPTDAVLSSLFAAQYMRLAKPDLPRALVWDRLTPSVPAILSAQLRAARILRLPAHYTAAASIVHVTHVHAVLHAALDGTILRARRLWAVQAEGGSELPATGKKGKKETSAALAAAATAAAAAQTDEKDLIKCIDPAALVPVMALATWLLDWCSKAMRQTKFAVSCVHGPAAATGKTATPIAPLAHPSMLVQIAEALNQLPAYNLALHDVQDAGFASKMGIILTRTKLNPTEVAKLVADLRVALVPVVDAEAERLILASTCVPDAARAVLEAKLDDAQMDKVMERASSSARLDRVANDGWWLDLETLPDMVRGWVVDGNVHGVDVDHGVQVREGVARKWVRDVRRSAVDVVRKVKIARSWPLWQCTSCLGLTLAPDPNRESLTADAFRAAHAPEVWAPWSLAYTHACPCGGAWWSLAALEPYLNNDGGEDEVDGDPRARKVPASARPGASTATAAVRGR